MTTNPMLRNIAFGLSVFSFSAAAQADTLGLSFRGAFLGVDSSVKVGDGDESTSNKPDFKIGRARLDYKAKPSKNTSYRLRLRFDKGAEKAANGQSGMVDFGYVKHKFTDMISVSLGRQSSKHGGAYGAYHSSKEGYYVGNNVYKMLTRISGAKVDFTVAEGQKISLAVANTLVSEKGEKEGTVTDSKAPMVGLIYLGEMGMLKPVFSYYTSPKGKTTKTADDGTETVYEAGAADTFLSLGTGIYTGGLSAAVDILNATEGGRKAVGADKAGDDTEHQSISVVGGYKVGAFKPVLNIENTTSKTGDDTETKTAFGLTLEYYPDAEVKGLRYYAGMTQESNVIESKSGGTTTETTVGTNSIYLGVAIDAKTKLN